MNTPSPALVDFITKFNHGLYFEAHDALEPAWLKQRGNPTHRFYKGLIQLAGAFVHLQKQRSSPALALFKLAHDNLRPFTPEREQIPVNEVLELIEAWQNQLSDEPQITGLLAKTPPVLYLIRNS